jgi:hypothetical protein
MTVSLRYIKKLMGWCPNVKTTEIGSHISPSHFETNDRSRGEKANSPQVKNQFSRIFSRLDVRLFLPTLILTPFYISMLFLKGVDSEALFIGILLPLLIYSLCWKKQMLWYDALAKKPNVRYFSKIVLFFVFLTLIWALIFPIRVFLSHVPSSINSESLYSFIAGLSFFIMWGTSLQLIYWEKKNHMKICIKNENGFLKTYAVGEKEGEL